LITSHPAKWVRPGKVPTPVCNQLTVKAAAFLPQQLVWLIIWRPQTIEFGQPTEALALGETPLTVHDNVLGRDHPWTVPVSMGC
jgi:hypothetical protein